MNGIVVSLKRRGTDREALLRNFYRFVADLPRAIISVPIRLEELLPRIIRRSKPLDVRSLALNRNRLGNAQILRASNRICHSNRSLIEFS